MGLDATIKILLPEPTDPETVAAIAVKIQRSMCGSGFFWIEPGVRHGLELLPDLRTVRVVTTARYYGPGYERGDWPTIAAALRLLQHHFPSGHVYYGHDADEDEDQLYTPELETSLWAHYMSDNGADYRALGGPMCDFCKIETSRVYGCGDTAGFACPSCQQRRLYRQLAFDRTAEFIGYADSRWQLIAGKP